MVLVSGGYCDEHKPKTHTTERSEEAAAWHRWYSLPIWTEDLRPAQLLREPWCAECARAGIRTRATDVDHIRDHKGNWAVFTDRSNLQSLCHSHHSQKTAQDLWEKRHKKRRR